MIALKTFKGAGGIFAGIVLIVIFIWLGISVYVSTLAESAKRYDDRGHYEKEIVVLNKIIAVNTYTGGAVGAQMLPHVYLMLGFANQKLGRMPEAVRNLEKAVRLFSKDSMYKDIGRMAQAVLDGIQRERRGTLTRSAPALPILNKSGDMIQ